MQEKEKGKYPNGEKGGVGGGGEKPDDKKQNALLQR